MKRKIVLSSMFLSIGFILPLFTSQIKEIGDTLSIYISLLSAMLMGRIVWGISKALLLGMNGEYFSFALFISGRFIDALPGILLQLILIPRIMKIIKRKGEMN